MDFKEKLMQSPLYRKASHWYYGLSGRDQNALKLLTVAVVLTLLYLLVWVPSQRFVESAERDLERQSAQLAWMKQNEPVARQLASRSSPTAATGLQGQSLLSVVSNAAKQHSIELRRFEPEGDSRIRVWLEKVSFNQMLLWLDVLNKEYGIQTEQIAVDRDANPGIVTARLTLSI